MQTQTLINCYHTCIRLIKFVTILKMLTPSTEARRVQ